MKRTLAILALALLVQGGLPAADSPPPGSDSGGAPRRTVDFDGPPPFAPGPGGGPPMGVREERKLVARFDRDGNGRLDAAERKAARAFLAQEREEGRSPRRGARRFGREEDTPPPEPGPRVAPTNFVAHPGVPLYASNVVRTFFLEFEDADWERELGDFKDTDVEVPARLTVDGSTYPDVGVHFRGASSFMMVGEGRKRSFNLSLDFVHEDQRLLGYRTLNLLNAHRDPTFLRSVLYYHIARHYVPAPQANFVKLVINGESWGLYVNVQQFNKEFMKEWFGDTRGARWKVPGSPRGRAGLAYLGEEVAPYRQKYEIKSKDDPKSWAALIALCRTLEQTPLDRLEGALAPMLDIEHTLWFLALENVFINSDGYWIRASDYGLALDGRGRFHLIPYDANETFNRPERSPRRGGADGRGLELDPLAGSDDPEKPLLHRLLAVPALRERYLTNVRTLAETWLDWRNLGPVVEFYHRLIADELRADTRKLTTYEAFQRGVTAEAEAQALGGREAALSLRAFADQRRAFLLSTLVPRPTP
ncbi:MAG TPA: CotH kinase family protein [Methylomirabilota bacterium]|nr:CotH kinase family protein [Methylomirabilota bacterium]